MSRQRSVSTSLWSKSERFGDSSPMDRYLFLYLITNHDTELCGAYEQSIRDIAHFTRLSPKRVCAGFASLEKQGLAKYIDGWVVIPKYMENAKVDNPNVRKGIERSMSLLPEEIRKALEGFESVTPVFADLDLNLDSNLDLEEKNPRYDNLVEKYGKSVVDDYIERVKDWAKSKGKRYKDYTAAAANWMKKDEVAVVTGYNIKPDHNLSPPVCECGGDVTALDGEAMCKGCDKWWKFVDDKWVESD